MPPETLFRIAVVAVMVLTSTITLYHRLQAASSGEKISRKDERFSVRHRSSPVWSVSHGRHNWVCGLSVIRSMGFVSAANVDSLAGYRHWDVVFIPDVLDSQQPRQEPDGYSSHKSRSDSDYARPISLGATSILCDYGIAHGVRDSAGSELADRCRKPARVESAGCSHAERRANAD